MSRDSSSWIEKILKKPHIVISILAIFVLAGVVGYGKMDRNLFPNSNYPEVAIVVVELGASAQTIATNVAVPIEKELYTLDEIRRAHSDTIDEMTVIRAEFEYNKDVDAALNDVSSIISKIRAKLPSDIKEPQIIKITKATAPIMVVAMSPKDGSKMSLDDIRDIASGRIKQHLLQSAGVSNVDIFGGNERELQIVIGKNKLDSMHLSPIVKRDIY